jgi:hypothetical protein
MARRLSVSVTLASFALALALALAFAGASLATSPAQPSARACLVAWNSAANRSNQVRLLAQRPVSGVRLLPGMVGTDTWTKGSAPKETSAPACLLALTKPGEIRVVTGVWRTRGVSRWSFGRPIRTGEPFAANVRLLSDGRVTTIHRH